MSETQEERIDLAKKLDAAGIDPRIAAIGAVKSPEAAVVWETPVHDIDLPSRGKVYPQSSTLHGKNTVEIRSMTAKEEDILTSRSLLRQGKAMSSLLKSCVMDKTIDPEDMLVGDRNAILVAIRMTGYGAEYETSMECPVCGDSFEHTFNISELSKVREIEVEPDVEGQNLFSFELPVSKVTVKFKLLTGRDDRELSVQQDRMKKAQGLEAVEGNVTLRLFSQVVSINGEEDRTKVKRLVDNMPAMDSRKLRAYIDKIAPGLDMSSFVQCTACGDESEVDMPIGSTFFWPDA